MSGLELSNGGPSYSVPRLNRALRQAGVDARVFADVVPGEPANDGDDGVLVFPRQFSSVPGLRKLHVSTALAARLDDPAELIDLIHSHGLWRMPNVYAARAARRRGIPILVSPRGMLSPAALEFSRWSKDVFWQLCQRTALEAPGCFHATSTAERDDVRRFGCTAPIAVIPNGVDLPEVPDRRASRGASGTGGQRTLLFLGRIHPIKAVDMLVEAWRQVAPEFPGWRLRIVGPGEPVHIKLITDIIAAQCVPRVGIEGALNGAAKFHAFAAADLFVQPSTSENFGLTVAESLACRRPVIVTKGAPWAGVETHGCGWWIDLGEAAMVAGLRQALATPDAVLDEMGRRGEAWVRSAFSWERIGADMADVYRWLCGRGDKPGCVET